MPTPPDPIDALPGLHLCLLNTPRLERADGRGHALERKDAALLALLAQEGPTLHGKAAALLWPDTTDTQARANLRQRLFRLRRAAGRDVVLADGALRLAPALSVDLLQAPAALASDPDAAAGELLGQLDYADNEALAAWVAAARLAWRQTRLEALAGAAARLEVELRVAAALPYAQRIVAEDPLREHGHRRLMRLHYLRHDRAAALAAYQRCREAIALAFGSEPDAETRQLAALIESSGTLPQAAPVARAVGALRPPRLVGRDGPWRQLQRAHAAHGVVLVEGDAGIGKTRLMSDFADAHDHAPVFGARPGDDRLPYASLARLVRGLAQRYGAPAQGWVCDALSPIAPELGRPRETASAEPAGDALPARLVPLRVQQAVAEGLAQWRAAGLELLVFDDLHFADAASVEMLPALVAGAEWLGTTWLLGVRRDETPPVFAAWLATQAMQTVQRVLLEALDGAAVADLLLSLGIPGFDAPRWAPALARHTGGNPLFLLETLIVLLDGDAHAIDDPASVLPTPGRVGELIERRLAQLAAPALKLARIAAIAGPDFDAGLAADVLGVHALDLVEPWRALEQAGVIHEDAFAHDLILDGTLRSIPQPVARLLHAAVAQALQARGAPAARVAGHWFEAHEWGRAGTAYAQAAQHACAASRRVEEAAWWDAAIDSHRRAGDRAQAFKARCDSIDAGLVTRTVDRTLAVAEGLRADAEGDDETLAALLAHARVLLTAGRGAEARPVADEALVLARALGRPWREFDAARIAALTLAQGPHAAQAASLLATFAPLVQREGSPAQRLGYFSDMAYALHRGNRRAEAARHWADAIDAARALGDTAEMLTCTSNLAGLASQLGRLQQTLTHAEKACRLLDALGNPEGVAAAAAANVRAMAQAQAGHFDAALQGFDDAAQRLGAGAGVLLHMIETSTANLWLQLGQVTRARQALRPIPDAVAALRPDTGFRRLTIEARIERLLGKSALPLLALAVQRHGASGEPLIRLLADLDRSREQDPAEAIAECRRVHDSARSLELLAIVMRARVLLVEALSRAGEHDAAAAEAADVARELGTCQPADLYGPEAWWIVHRAFAAAGDAAGAAHALDVAVCWIRDTALPHVPVPFRSSFLQRNPVNRAVLAAAGLLLSA